MDKVEQYLAELEEQLPVKRDARGRFVKGTGLHPSLVVRPGERRRHSAGYVLVYAPDHPRAYKRYVYEHILVWEEKIGPLPQGVSLHHRNGDKTDNRLVNLEPMRRDEHTRHHMTPDRARAMQKKTTDARKRNGSYTKTHCARGHPFDEENTYIRPDTGRRDCRTCREARFQRSYAKKRRAKEALDYNPFSEGTEDTGTHVHAVGQPCSRCGDEG